MANDGFKGTRVMIDRLSVEPGPGGTPVLSCSVQFGDDDGVIHAVANHSILLDPEMSTDGIAPLVNELLQRVTKKIEALHFTRPHSADNPVLKGIAETLQAPRTDSDDLGTQG